jgi:HEAT repeat protein
MRAAMSASRLGAWLILALLLPTLSPGQNSPPLHPDEQILKDAGLGSDNRALLDFFRARTPNDTSREHLTALVKKLGHDLFSQREEASDQLIKAGAVALPFLREAIKERDLEVARRAEECIQAIEQTPHFEQAAAALRLLAQRKPAQTAEVLLAFASFASENLETELFTTLAAVALGADGKPTAPLLAALRDNDVARRTASVFALGRLDPVPRDPLTPLFKDPTPRIRYGAARALLRTGAKDAVPVLTALLGEGTPPLVYEVEELLGQVAGESAPSVALGAADEPARKKSREAWETWWQANEKKIDLSRWKPDLPLGIFLTCEVDGLGDFPGRVAAFGRDNKLRWKVEGVRSPADMQLLPSGRVLVAEHWANRVTERDRSGKVLWEFKTTTSPVSCKRLPGGNTFLATNSEVIEVTPDQKVVFRLNVPSMVYCAEKLPNGNVLYAQSSGFVREITTAGQEVRSFKGASYSEGASYWVSVETLPGGRYLIAYSGTGKVIETDATGKILWECDVPKCGWATRLANGHTLIANVDDRYVVEVDRTGKEVWRQTTQGRPFRVKKY